jgi:transcriptional regulator with XRE-family HTH domain
MMKDIDPTQGVELLLDLGLRRRIVNANTIEIASRKGKWTPQRVVPLRHSPTPSEIKRDLEKTDPPTGLFYVVHRAGTALSDAAGSDKRIAYAAIQDGMVSFLGEIYNSSEHAVVAATPRRRIPWARYGIVRLLALSSTALTQVDIARRTGVSQAAVSQTMSHLDNQVARTLKGWHAIDRGALWDYFMRTYPGPGGLATYWLAIDDPASQLARVRQASRTPEKRNLVSGDIAADHYAPWRRPSRVVLYTSSMKSLHKAGFAEARAHEASLEIRVAADPTIAPMAGNWETSGQHHSTLIINNELVDPLLAAWDMNRTPGPDVPEALHKLRNRALRMAEWR